MSNDKKKRRRKLGVTFWGRGGLGALGGQVGLLVEDEEGGHAQLPRTQKLHACLRAGSVGHNHVIQRRRRCRHRHVKLGVDRAQVTCEAHALTCRVPVLLSRVILFLLCVAGMRHGDGLELQPSSRNLR
jgi:hypothetical protein